MVVPSSSVDVVRLKDKNVELELERSTRTIIKLMWVIKLGTRVNIHVRKKRLLLVLNRTK